MLLNVHSYYSLRYGTLSIEQLLDNLQAKGYDSAVLTDINNSSGVLEYIKVCVERKFNGLAGMEFRNGDDILYIGIAKNLQGFQELNELMSACNIGKKKLPETAPVFNNVYVIYPFGTKDARTLRDYEYIGVKPKHLNKLWSKDSFEQSRYVIWQPITFINRKGYNRHKEFRAINNNVLISQLYPSQVAGVEEYLYPKDVLLKTYQHFPHIVANTNWLLSNCSFDFDFKEPKNKKVYGASRQDDKELLEKLAIEGMRDRYGANNKEAVRRVRKELDIIDELGFSSYFLITWDIIRYAKNRGFYHVGRGSGANSVVAYCLRITDVCPIELDLYFERFLNKKRKTPPDFDIDFSHDQRDDIYDYIFKRHGTKHTALMGATGTFKDRSIVRELGKAYGLPKNEIDRLIKEPEDKLNDNEITRMIMSIYNDIVDFPNLRTIHPSGVLISDLPITAYTALDMPPKNFQTAQIDMYTAEDIGFEKFDILSQRGIGHIKETVEIVKQNRGKQIDVFAFEKFKNDKTIQEQLRTGDTIGCFYVESPAMRQLLKKLHCSTYLTLVAASSIIRPGVASSGMMKAYIERFHDPSKTTYLHPIMQEQLKETYGVMVYQEDVLKIGIHFFGLSGEDADLLRRMMSGKFRGKHHLIAIREKAFAHTQANDIPDGIAKEVWRQLESFAGYSFSKAHSASFAVESFQSLFLKTYYPLEFMTAVINNEGGFYSTRVYVHEARKAGATIHLPCINRSNNKTVIYGTDIFLGLRLVKGLEWAVMEGIISERDFNGEYTSLENFIMRTGIHLEQAIILIRLGAFRFTDKSKPDLLWEAHFLLSKAPPPARNLLFTPTTTTYTLPVFDVTWIEDAYDELELLGFTVTCSPFNLLQTKYRGEAMTKNMLDYVGREVKLVCDFVCDKDVRTKNGGWMKFGTFLDINGDFLDTTHFPPAQRAYPLKGSGLYLLLGKVVEEFGFPSIEIQKAAKLPILSDPRNM